LPHTARQPSRNRFATPSKESEQEMNHTYIARLVAAAALVVSVGSAAAPQVASAATLASATYQGQQTEEPPQFSPPEADGMTAGPNSEAAMISEEPVEGGPGMTGIVGQDQAQGQ
jgi:hypothetical protein